MKIHIIVLNKNCVKQSFILFLEILVGLCDMGYCWTMKPLLRICCMPSSWMPYVSPKCKYMWSMFEITTTINLKYIECMVVAIKCFMVNCFTFNLLVMPYCKDSRNW
jgi:hypothetical protein